MKNKILIQLYIVEIGESFDIYVPTNEYIGKLIKAIVSSSFELVDIEPKKNNYNLIDPDTGKEYEKGVLVRESNIKNAKKLYLI